LPTLSERQLYPSRVVAAACHAFLNCPAVLEFLVSR